MLSFWDDGLPVHETLRHGLAKDGIIAPAFAIAEPLTYRVKHTSLSGASRTFERLSQDLPTRDASDEEFLLAALYPGVTSDPTGVFHAPHPEVTGKLAGLAGMGLANLINAAVDIFHGSAAFRSGSLFMNVKATPTPRGAVRKSGRYAVKVDDRWAFNGNLVTVRLPLRKIK
jgi:hypothetical protein